MYEAFDLVPEKVHIGLADFECLQRPDEWWGQLVDPITLQYFRESSSLYVTGQFELILK